MGACHSVPRQMGQQRKRISRKDAKAQRCKMIRRDGWGTWAEKAQRARRRNVEAAVTMINPAIPPTANPPNGGQAGRATQSPRRMGHQHQLELFRIDPNLKVRATQPPESASLSSWRQRKGALSQAGRDPEGVPFGHKPDPYALRGRPDSTRMSDSK